MILLHYFSGLTHEQIAATLGTSPQAVHGRLLRARRKMAEDLRRNGFGKERTMSFPKDDNELDSGLGRGVHPAARPISMPGNGSTPKRLHVSIHSESSASTRRRRIMSRAAVFAAAAAVLVCVLAWRLRTSTTDGHGSMAFAQIFDEIQKAKTITWKTTFYVRITSKDGKRTWLRTETRQ